MNFANPTYLYLLWSIPLLIAFSFAFIFKKHKKRLEKIAPQKQFIRLVPLYSFSRFKIKIILLIFALIPGIIALSRPQWGYTWEEATLKGLDIVIAIDVSDSMRAEDVSPNRLERAKRKIQDLLKIMNGDRVALIAFAGAAFLQSPLTSDYNAVSMFLDYIDTDLIPVKGTNLGEVLGLGIKSLETSQNNAKAILLLTDGEDLDEGALSAAQEARKKGIRLYSIGIGSEKGAPIPNKEGGGFRKDQNGEIIFSKLNESVLLTLAKETGGDFVRSVSSDNDLIKIYEHEMKKALEDQEFKSTRKKNIY